VRRRIVTLAVLLLPGLGLVAGGIHELVALRTGTPARATVVACHDTAGKYGSGTCTGTWVEGGSLLEGGHVVSGTIDGAGPSDVGKRVDVRLSGGRAYTTSYRIPVVLFFGGAVFLGLWASILRGMLRRRKGSTSMTV
jgi:hypothetical protein